MLNYHPHIHYVVAGGAISKKDGSWQPSRLDFYVPVVPLSRIFRAKFRDEMKKQGLFSQIPPDVWKIDWNVNIQAVGSAASTVKYLAPYVFKVAITNSRIVKVEDGKVTFRYKKSGSSRYRTTTLDAMEFIRRFLQHVLPSGFMKIRYYGFMHPSSAITRDEVENKIELSFEFDIQKPEIDIEPAPETVCPKCGGKLTYCYSILPFMFGRQDE